MSEVFAFHRRYYIVWLDQHIGDPQACLLLKRAFFTHIDPDSGCEVRLSDTDISNLIREGSSVPVTFDGFQFTLKAFIEEEPCLQYIDTIQNDRILFISSSTMGESAVKKLISRYPRSFTNMSTQEPYDSIYIFCMDTVKASVWARSYYEYVKIFDHEADLLTRMTRDLGEEFLNQGEQLHRAHQYEAAVERLGWAKSLYIRHDKLKLVDQPNNQEQRSTENVTAVSESVQQSQPPVVRHPQPKSIEKLKTIDKLLDEAEKRVKEQRETDSDVDRE